MKDYMSGKEPGRAKQTVAWCAGELWRAEGKWHRSVWIQSLTSPHQSLLQWQPVT